MAKKATASKTGFVFSDKTLTILKNFAKYNENILMLPGNTLRTMTAQKNVFASATIEEELPREAAIYNLNELLNCLSLFEHPSLEFDTKAIKIFGEGSSLDYLYADKSIIVYPEKDVRYPAEFDVEFKLGAKDLDRVMQAARLMSLPNVCLRNDDDGNMYLRAHDASNDSSNKFDVKVGTTDIDGHFEATFRMENLKLLEIDYDVSVSFKGIARFKNDDFGIEYGVGLAPSVVPGS